MGRTACTESQRLYKCALYLLVLCAVMVALLLTDTVCIGESNKEGNTPWLRYCTIRMWIEIRYNTIPLLVDHAFKTRGYYAHRQYGKGKAVPLQAWSCPEGSRRLRFPDFMTTAQDGGKVVSLTHWLPLPP